MVCLLIVVWGIGTHGSLIIAVALGKLPLQTYLNIKYDLNSFFHIPLTFNLLDIYIINTIFFMLFLVLKPKKFRDIAK